MNQTTKTKNNQSESDGWADVTQNGKVALNTSSKNNSSEDFMQCGERSIISRLHTFHQLYQAF